MQKNSFLFLIVIAGVALLAAYYAPTQLTSSILMVRFTALAAFFMLSVSLIIGPLAAMDSKYFPLIEPRRALGIAAFAFVLIHFLLVLALYFDWQALELLNYFPIVLAIPATVILLAMTLTSSDWAVQKMGMGKWKMLQMFVYPAFILILAHFVLQAGKHKGLNEAEITLLALGAVAILFQLYGFYLRKSKRITEAGS